MRVSVGRARGGAVSVDGGSGVVTLGTIGASGGTTLRGTSLNFGAVNAAALDAVTAGALAGGGRDDAAPATPRAARNVDLELVSRNGASHCASRDPCVARSAVW